MSKHTHKQVFDAKKVYKYNSKTDSYVIDISLDYYHDVYDEWDYSPFKKRDIDKDLIHYLEECSLEIPLRSKIVINFHLPENSEDPDQESKSVLSIRNYFHYTMLKMTNVRKRYYMSVTRYTIIGLIFLITAFMIQNLVSSISLLNIVPEGLFIGGWVLFWEAFSIAFFKNHDLRFRMREYKRLSQSNINFIYDNVSANVN